MGLLTLYGIIALDQFWPIGQWREVARRVMSDRKTLRQLGFLGGSHAVIAEGAHDGGDVALAVSVHTHGRG